MPETMCAEIWLGGRVARRLVLGLCRAIAKEYVATDYGEGRFSPRTATDLLAACTVNGSGVRVLRLCDDEARWGEFESLEAFLRRHKIAYSRRSEGKGEFEPCRVEFRPPRSLLNFTTNYAGAVVTPIMELAAISADCSTLQKSPCATQHTALRALARRLQRALPPVVPPLAPFEIVNPHSRSSPRGR